MPADTAARVLADINERLAVVSGERKALERDLRERLGVLQEEERRLHAAAKALAA